MNLASLHQHETGSTDRSLQYCYCCQQVRKERDIKKIEFTNPSKRKECSEVRPLQTKLNFMCCYRWSSED